MSTRPPAPQTAALLEEIARLRNTLDAVMRYAGDLGEAIVAECAARQPPATPETPVVLEAVHEERRSQELKWGPQEHPFGFDLPGAQARAGLARMQCDEAAKVGRCTWRHILEEEVAELLAAKTLEEMEAEAIQVAAVAVQIVEKVRAARAGGAR